MTRTETKSIWTDEPTYPALPHEDGAWCVRQVTSQDPGVVYWRNDRVSIFVDLSRYPDGDQVYRRGYAWRTDQLWQTRTQFTVAELRQLLNAAVPGAITDDGFDADVMTAAVGCAVLVRWVLQKSTYGADRSYMNPTWSAAVEHPSARIRRLLEWGELPRSSIEVEIGEAERQMEACERSGDPRYADRWAHFIEWCRGFERGPQ